MVVNAEKGIYNDINGGFNAKSKRKRRSSFRQNDTRNTGYWLISFKANG